MKITNTKFEGLVLIEIDRYKDERGEFMELYNSMNYDHLAMGQKPFVQDNYSISKKGVFRGLHFQSPPFGQSKLIQVLSGKATDLALDLRSNSNTYGDLYQIELSGDDNLQLFIPRGFAHGFLSHEENTRFHYKCDNFYSKDHERTLFWEVDKLDIDFPTEELIISRKDQEGQHFVDFVSPF